jgi:phosphoserine phosphatase RsbU/P
VTAKARLEWSETPERRDVLPLAEAEIVIGRRAGLDIVLSHPLVSRQHARILPEGEAFEIFDLGSSHGTWVNGNRIDRHTLRSRDRIRLGQLGLELTFLSGDEDAAGATVVMGQATIASGLLDGAGIENAVSRLAAVLPDKSDVHSELEKFSCLLDFHYNFGKTFSAERTFHHIVKSALSISGAERGFILRKEHGENAQGENAQGEFAYAAGLDSTGNVLGATEFRTSGTVVDKVVKTGAPVFMTQGIHGELAAQQSIVAMNLRAIACLPLEGLSAENDAPTVMGILYLDSQKQMQALSGLDEKLLIRLAGEAGRVLEKLDMVVTLAERKRVEAELAVAEQTQRSLLPRSLPQAEPFRIRAFSRPTRQLGGDFYDFIEVGDGLLTGLLADVSGKGIPAALLSSLAIGALNMEFRTSSRSELVLGEVNKLLCRKTPENRFVTLFLFQLDTDGHGHFIGAGHNPAYLYRAASGEVEELLSGGMPLGMFTFAAYEPTRLELRPGDILLVYSDGLTEAENRASEDFGEERVLNLLKSLAPQGVEAIEKALLTELDQFTQGAMQSDDITFMLIQHAVPVR